MVYQEEHESLDWPAIDSLAKKLGINLDQEVVKLSVFPKKMSMSMVELIDAHVFDVSPTGFTVILSVIALSPRNGVTKYLIGFAPASSSLDHEAAIKLLDSPNHISRAYYKIQEACERCRVHNWPQSQWNAIDIGASPGGWSLYLSQVVGKVYAVDPGVLEVTAPNIVHVRSLLSDAVSSIEKVQFNVIVCDINEYPPIALKCLVSVREMMAPGAIIIWTFKYPKRSESNIAARIKTDSALFIQEFPKCRIVKVLHLLSNHHERTLIARNEG